MAPHRTASRHPRRADGTPTRPGRFLGRAILSFLIALILAAPAAAAPDIAQHPGGSPDSTTSQWTRRSGTSGMRGAGVGGGSGLEGAIDPASYILGPGDELVLEFAGRLTTSRRAVVDPEGDLWVEDFGRIRVAGLSLVEARTRLRRMMIGSSKGIDVYLRLSTPRKFKVYITGEVQSPGVVDVSAGTRVSESIALAGGFTAAASQRNILLRSPRGATRTVDLMRFERAGDRDANAVLGDGDQVQVPKRTESIFLYAPVPYSGEYEYRAGDRLGTLITLGGGFLPSALRGEGRLLRFVSPTASDTIAVDLGAADSLDRGPTLNPGDRLFVPHAGDYHPDYHVTLTGELNRPGVYPLREGEDRLTTMLEAAGGFTPAAARHAVLVVRRSENTLERDPEFDRLSRLSRREMTEAEYQTFRTKLASAQSVFTVDASLPREGEVQGADPTGSVHPARDVLLRHDDVVVVERESPSVRVSGLVRRPGLVAYGLKLTGGDYIESAGGYAQGANHNKVRVTRAASGQTLLLRDVSSIEPGDLIYVPDRPDRNVFALFRDLLVVAGSVATIVIAFRK